MKSPHGTESKHDNYYPERRAYSWSRRPNPHGYTCHWCDRVIPWEYRGEILFNAPRFYCPNSVCQKVRENRVTAMDELQVSGDPRRARG